MDALDNLALYMGALRLRPEDTDGVCFDVSELAEYDRCTGWS
jgi:hypothetical protein